MTPRILIGLVLCTLCGAGCVNPRYPTTGDTHSDLRSPDPQVRMVASRKAGKQRDYSAVPTLLQNLREEDPNNRLWGHIALLMIYHGPGYAAEKKIPERPFQFDAFSEDEAAREAAIRRWEQWWDTEGKKLAEKVEKADNPSN